MQPSKDHPLKCYLNSEKMNFTEAGALFECAGTTIARIIERDAPPSPQLMQRIIDKTNGALLPNQFYRLPRSAAE